MHEKFVIPDCDRKEPDDPGYLAYGPTMPGCFSNGLIIEEAKTNMRAAIQPHVESLLDNGQTVPQNPAVVHVEELTVGLPA